MANTNDPKIYLEAYKELLNGDNSADYVETILAAKHKVERHEMRSPLRYATRWLKDADLVVVRRREKQDNNPKGIEILSVKDKKLTTFNPLDQVLQAKATRKANERLLEKYERLVEKYKKLV